MPRRLQPKTGTGRGARKISDELRQIWKPSSTHPNIWFHSINGHTYELKECCLLDLTDEEIRILQKVALTKLQNLNLGVSISIPKDDSGESYKSKEGGLLLKVRRSHTANITQLLDMLKDKDGEKQEENGTGVFGIPLGRCVANDEERLRRRSQQGLRPDCAIAAVGSSGNVLGVPGALTQSTSHQNLACVPSELDDCGNALTRSLPGSDSSSEEEEEDSTEESCSSRLRVTTCVKRSASSVSPSTAHAQRTDSNNCKQSTVHRRFLIDDPLVLAAQVNKPALTVSAFVVPKIVNACCTYLEQNGLNAVGLFRIGSSKKRLKELKDEYDAGKDIVFDDSCNPHDAATLLKEFFRDLPEPLLTRDLYNVFLSANKKLSGTASYQAALQYLISLLPRLNRNTLWKLLVLLDLVARSSSDTVDPEGRSVVGNKMDAHNLASMLGPNILHKSKPGSGCEWSSAPASEQKQEQMLEEQTTVASVVHDLIVLHRELFTLPAALYDEMLRCMNELQPEDVHFILSCRLRGAWPPPLPPPSPALSHDRDATMCRKVSLGADCVAAPPKRQQSFSGQPGRRGNTLSMFALGDAHRTVTAVAHGLLDTSSGSPAGDQPVIRVTDSEDLSNVTNVHHLHSSLPSTLLATSNALGDCASSKGDEKNSSVASAPASAPATSPSLQRYCRR